ncbi:hypothetical protein BGX28_002684 [Mortierella sp. GBA30]|nr:hypothetical protein BGX28_002684 [Mortierella sp. GBA30]
MRTHWRIKPYSCPECHRNFVRQDALTRHLRLDFGHNRCSGYPGPTPGTAANPDKTDPEDSADDAMDTPSESSFQAVSKVEDNGVVKPGPAFSSSSPISPIVAKVESDQERIHAQPTHDRKAFKLAASPESVQPRQEFKEEREHDPHRDINTRYASASTAPMSFIHRSASTGRRAASPPEVLDPSLHAQHSRSYSQSTFTQGQPPAPMPHSSSAMALPSSAGPSHLQISGPSLSNAPPGPDRRTTIPTRNGAPWPAQGHEPAPSAEYYHTPLRQPSNHALSRPESSYGAESDHVRVEPSRMTTHTVAEYPTSPQEQRRPSPGTQYVDWDVHRHESSRLRGWDPRHQEPRSRHTTWSSSTSNRSSVLPHHPQEHITHPHPMPPPRASTMESWSRPPVELRDEGHRESREGPVRMMSRVPSSYPASPYPLDSPESHPRGPPGAPPAQMRVEGYRRPELERDPRQRSMSEMDRVRAPVMSWSEQRSRSFHEDAVESRPRYEPHPNSAQSLREQPPNMRPPPGEASLSGPDRQQHVYGGGMAGVERMYAPPQPGPYHERDLIREPSYSSKAPLAKESNGPEHRASRSQSALEYESNRLSFTRQQTRYTEQAPQPLPHELRRSVSPPPGYRTLPVDGRPYDNGVRYPYPGERSDPYGREEMERTSRSFRHEDRAVMSPLAREDPVGREPQGGYFSEAHNGRPNSYHQDSRGYGPPAPPLPSTHRQDTGYRQADPHYDPMRRERHSVEISMGPAASNAPPTSKRSLSAATLPTR